jgi:hypothetical protein
MPPQVVLANAAGQALIPRIPVGNCGLPASAVLVALNALPWQPVSVRLIAKVPGPTPPTAAHHPPAPANPAVPPSSPTAPAVTQSAGGGHVHPG